jgi:hypothetical protein
MATSMAAVSSARITAVYGSPSLFIAEAITTGAFAEVNLRYSDAGLIYPVNAPCGPFVDDILVVVIKQGVRSI